MRPDWTLAKAVQRQVDLEDRVRWAKTPITAVLPTKTVVAPQMTSTALKVLFSGMYRESRRWIP